jgi:pimeloyl-ACP methyl ester carboxylesterase
MRRLRLVALALAVTVLMLLLGPFLVPVPPLPCTTSPQGLADADSVFVPVGNLQVHATIAGSGEPTLVVLHGFADSTFSWQEAIAALDDRSTVVAFDRPGFGLTSGPLWPFRDANPYTPEAQANLTVALMEALGIERAVLVGHSAGGAIAALVALSHPERVEALVLEAPAVEANLAPTWVQWLARTPQGRYLGPLAARALPLSAPLLIRLAWHDPGSVTAEELVGYARAFQLCHWDRALWEHVAAGNPPNIVDRLDALRVPILLVTGDDDRVVPTAATVRLADSLQDARLVVARGCGHVAHEECTETFVRAVTTFLDDLDIAP